MQPTPQTFEHPILARRTALEAGSIGLLGLGMIYVYQGEMKAISTSVSGINICEALPQTAKIMDRLTVARSLTYPLHGTVYATTSIPEVDTKIEAMPRHKRQLAGNQRLHQEVSTCRF